jgi:hypothetical protein
MLVGGAPVRATAKSFFTAGLFGLSASGRATAAAMEDGDKEEEKGDYGEVLHSRFDPMPSSARRPTVWAIKLS